MASVTRVRSGLLVAAVIGLCPGPAAAVSPAVKCDAAKLKIAGKYNFCRLKAEGKAIKTGDPVDYSKCDASYADKWMKTESNDRWGMCPTIGDQVNVQNQVTADAEFILLKLAGERFVDNGDGTVTDVQTGLMWEKKTDDGGIHDKDNTYSWSTGSPYGPTGTVFTTFLGTLNNGTSADGSTISGCFANHCDWRLPTSAELQTILLAPYPCGSNPCIDVAFGPIGASGYWSSTTSSGNPGIMWYVHFGTGFVAVSSKTGNTCGRGVRGGL